MVLGESLKRFVDPRTYGPSFMIRAYEEETGEHRGVQQRDRQSSEPPFQATLASEIPNERTLAGC
jgi:hypothetical protein